MEIIWAIFFSLCAGGVSRAADPVLSHQMKTPVVEESWFRHIDGIFAKGEYIDLSTNSTERLYIRYGPISDSGVELERSAKNAVLWRVHVQPLGVSHSKYTHKVWVRIEDGKIMVHSFGAKQIFEVRDLKSGQLITRDVSDNK